MEQKRPLKLLVCENCGYAESYVEAEDIEMLKSLSERQERLSGTRDEGPGAQVIHLGSLL